ncbi:spore coat associated protein CotJA [Anaerocolumna sp. AGMB13025]|uniref:spore coat associated protein CotJA n=1 Tax=Anaerocolumna sp. AGMB13025 TaxID=3039116 RepID=UPI00241EF6BE|nr:spore coat associated protein CotJA [Anaerocolumna sp. AGMB13025]WFR57004.1 spore coat associated protein CotJA [Anaerocolumna sp. AGMB13025]
MDNYRRPMNTRYNRNMGNMGNMGSYQNPQCGCGVTPVMEAGADRCCDKEADIDRCVDKLPLAMAYVPFQKWRKVWDASTGLAAGTIFEELYKPWYGDKKMCGMRGDRP